MTFIRTNHPRYAQAHKVAKAFGGPAALATALGLNPSTVYKWMTPRSLSKDGTDGVIPTRTLLRIRDLARYEGFLLTESDLSLTLYSPEDEK